MEKFIKFVKKLHEMPHNHIETHPFEPFLPAGAKVLFLGTFPPKPDRWSMNFYYPNKINDFWRVMGIIFFDDKEHFWDHTTGAFCLPLIKQFLTENGIALHDTAHRVQRLKDNASDKFLNIVETVNIGQLLSRCPTISAVVATGEKAATVVAQMAGVSTPAIGVPTICDIDGHRFTLWRMPSTSRAYPLSLEKKADAYRKMLQAEKILQL